LVAACPSCGEENPDRAKFCLDCGTPLAAAPPPVRDEERKLDTLVFVDLVGSTALAESLDPEDVLGLLDLYYTRLRAELERCGGTVEKYIGDAIVTHFGVPVAHEDDPERAVRAAFAILETVERLNADDPIRHLEVRIGIATGEVIVTLGARAEEGKGIAWGDILNTAARIESAAPVMGILVGEETYRASAHTIEYEEQESIVAKGKSEPVRVWRAVRIRDASVRGRTRDAKLVGRTAEVARVAELWERVKADGRPALATAVGDAGIGKSRLLSELVARVEPEASVHWGRCLSYGEGITYWPVAEILEAAAGILKSDDPDTVSTKLGTLLEELGTDDLDQLRTMAAAVANLVGVPRTPRGTYSATEISQAELHWGIRRILELLAAKRPLVLVLEDLHWAEPTLLDLLDYLMDAAGPILVLASGRRELTELRPVLCTDGERRVALMLTALSEADSETLLAELLGSLGLPAGSRAEELLRNAGGNPLFLEETVRMLAAAGAFSGGADVGEIAVPTTLQALIGSRLDALPADDKRIAQHASVVGMVFWAGAVAELTSGSGELDDSLRSLEATEVIQKQAESTVADDHEWQFLHALIRDVAYGRVPKGRRANLHVRLADWLVARAGTDEEFVEIVAYHLEQACKLAGAVGRSEVPPPVERAVEALSHAAERAERREGLREADRYYARALDLVGDGYPEHALELWSRRGGTLNRLGDFARAEQVLTDVAETATGLGRDDLRASALIGLSSIARKRGRAAEARAYVTEGETIAAATGDRGLEVRALYETANVHWWFDGATATALEEWRGGLTIAEELADEALQIEGHKLMVTVLYNLGELEAAEEQLVECAKLVRRVGSLRDDARVTFQLGLVKHHRGEIEEAERLSLQALAWLERLGDVFYQWQALRTLALCAVARSDLEAAEERLREAIPLALQIGGLLVVESYRCLVDVLILQDRLDDAGELAAFALQNLPEEDMYARTAGLLIEAAMATAHGQRTAAEEFYAEAVELLERQQLPLDLGEARVAYGRALRRLGDEAAARAQLLHARDDLVRIGARGLVGQIDAELAGLAEGAGLADPLAPA
jgi:class 3 adenylate cyclase/tetratricopeptide (TPR) repeat protein